MTPHKTEISSFEESPHLQDADREVAGQDSFFPNVLAEARLDRIQADVELPLHSGAGAVRFS